MRLGHARGLACAKTKKFPCIFLASPPPSQIFSCWKIPRPRLAPLHSGLAKAPHAFSPSAAKRKKKWKGNFWFCFAVSDYEKSTISLSLLVALFSALTATEAPCYPRLVVALASANHTQTPAHSPLASLALAASALCVFAWWLRESLVVTQVNIDCA